MATKPYQQKEWLIEQYHDKGRSMSDIADEFNMTTAGVAHWFNKHEIERRDQRNAQKPNKPYTHKEWLMTQYVENERSMADIGEECGVSAATILKWLRRHELKTRSANDHQKKSPASFVTVPRGYERVSAKHNNEPKYAYVHQLVAIAKGANPHDVFGGGNVVHHRNEIKWDNRPDNLEVMTQSEHRSHHATKQHENNTPNW